MKQRREICVDDNSKAGEIAYKLLNSCPPRKISQLVSIALADLSDKYNLASSSSTEISTFISFYEYMKKGGVTPVSSIQVRNETPYEERKKAVNEDRNNLVSTADKNKMDAIMKSFGI